ncbi:MAG: lamin tail domain-containing protein [Minicystis sp.]
MNPRILIAAFALLLGLAHCTVYNPNLVTTGGGQGASTIGSGGSSSGETTTASSGGGTAGSMSTTGEGGSGGTGPKPCAAASECPGKDNECQTRTCSAGMCGFDFTAAGKVLSAAGQMAADCLELHCDGAGSTTSVADDMDLPPIKDACTDATCDQGIPTFPAKTAGVMCMESGGAFCDGQGACVECLLDADCASSVCQANACAPAKCDDGVKNQGEGDVDCGGPCPAKCATGKTCGLADDCVGGVCSAGQCAPTCTDGVTNQGESDVDCGGPSCVACPVGKACGAPTDCATASCVGAVCACAGDHLMISEIRSRGPAGSTDEFVELYNPTAAPIALDATWSIMSRSTGAMNYALRWTGTGKMIPSHGHFLITNAMGYTQQPPGDEALKSGITDATSLELLSSGAVIDAVCYAFSAGTKATLMGGTYVCEGVPADNLPHKDSAGVGDADVSIQRKPGSLLGNCFDTGDSAADFVTTTPAEPQNSMSAPTP